MPTSVPDTGAPLAAVDVFRQINPLRDSARGTWTFVGTTLTSPFNEMGVLRLPMTPPAEYRLTLVVERGITLHHTRTVIVQPSYPNQPANPYSVPPHSSYSPRSSRTHQPDQRNRTMRRVLPPTVQVIPEQVADSDDGLDIVLPVNGRLVALVLDGWQRTISGLEMVDGKGADQNGTAFRGEVLPQFRSVTVICTVGAGGVDATVDGRTIVHWVGQNDRLTLDPGLAADVGNSPALVASSQFRIQRIEMMPLSRVPAPIVAVAATPGAVSAFPGAAGGQIGPSVSPGTAPPNSTAVPSPEALQCVALIQHPLGSGSGFAVGKKFVATNAHVVEGVFADEIKVSFGTDSGKPQHAARILFCDRSRTWPSSSCHPNGTACRSEAIMPMPSGTL